MLFLLVTAIVAIEFGDYTDLMVQVPVRSYQVLLAGIALYCVGFEGAADVGAVAAGSELGRTLDYHLNVSDRKLFEGFLILLQGTLHFQSNLLGRAINSTYLALVHFILN